ncbi:MAG: hypothetical protein KDD44_03295 [Bdellovibrionales bacterium]|nr:hypothetical protein [Bdellovibrionales bacterium]
MEKKLDALMVDTNLERRARLRDAAYAQRGFRNVQPVNGLDQALQRLQENNGCDVLFISYEFDREEILEFVKSAKNTTVGSDCAYIMVMKPKDQNAETVAQDVLDGADGFLFEPYSVENLFEITKISARVKKEQAEARVAAAIRMTIEGAIEEIDRVAMLCQKRGDSPKLLEKLQSICAPIRRLDRRGQNTYFELLTELFSEVPPPPSNEYRGASKRVREMLMRKRLRRSKQDESV